MARAELPAIRLARGGVGIVLARSSLSVAGRGARCLRSRRAYVEAGGDNRTAGGDDRGPEMTFSLFARHLLRGNLRPLLLDGSFWAWGAVFRGVARVSVGCGRGGCWLQVGCDVEELVGAGLD